MPPDQIDHSTAHPQLGIGCKPVLARPGMALCTFGQRDHPGLHQVFKLDPLAAAAVDVPSKPLDHRYEPSRAVGHVAAVCSGGAPGA